MIHEASWRGLFNFIFWLIAFSFILRLIVRLATPYVVRKAQDQMRNHMSNHGFKNDQKVRPEGEVTIEKQNNPERGEYTDYVEIKD